MLNSRRCRGSGLWLAGLLLVVPSAMAVQPATVPGRPPRPDPRPGVPNAPAAAAQPAAAQPAAAQPATPQPPASPPAQPGSPEDEITFSAFTEAIELTSLVDYVAKALNVNMYVKGGLTGSVVFNAPVSVKRRQLLDLLDALLEQQGYTVTLDPAGFYMVHPVGEVTVNVSGDTTRIIPTPNVRPTYLKPAIDSQLFGAAAQPGGAAPGGTTSKGIAYVDELGVIVITDTPRRVAAVQALVERLLEEYSKAQYIRLELKHIAAPAARTRALELVGQTTGAGGQSFVNPQTGEVQQQPQVGGTGKGIDNLSERLAVDQLGNALIFRGLPEEIAQVKEILALIDAETTLKPRSYYAGSAAKLVADIAKQRGLGEVTVVNAAQQQYPGQPYPVYINPGDFGAQAGQRRTTAMGGPVMVVDEQKGTILYYGTEDQQKAMEELIEQLRVEDEQVVIREYKLRHSDSKKVADLILNLIENTRPAATGDLLPGDSGADFTPTSRTRRRTQPRLQTPQVPGSPEGDLQINPDENVFVLADESNNQVLVKAPARQQVEFARLIEKLDLRRPQVYVEAKIVAVTSSDEFRLAFETQLINANGTGGVFNTNFGLSSFPTGSTQPILQPKTVASGLSGFTAALIKSDQVPIIMTALARDTDSRILSTPQLLVDDNEKATIASVDRVPFPTISRGTGGQGDIVTSDSSAEAGTTLTVTPQISSGGYLRLNYSIELSSFTGPATENLPPPSQENTIESESVTVPTGTTVVVGGLVLSNKSKTVVKVPLLGDIPLLGLLFSDTNKQDRRTTLYIFLTPRILRDPNFEDLRLLTLGPQAASQLPVDEPVVRASYIEIVGPEVVAPEVEGDAAPPPAPPVELEPVPLPPPPAAAPAESTRGDASRTAVIRRR